MKMNGTDLLAAFRNTRSEEAFSELVRRYANLVYSIAKRRLSNATLAEEVAQIVFTRLATAAPRVRGDAEFVAWLHRTTVHVLTRNFRRPGANRCCRTIQGSIAYC